MLLLLVPVGSASPAVVGFPAVTLTSTCGIDGTTFADLDADGRVDLAIQVNDTLYAWPSTGKGPWVWSLPPQTGADPSDVDFEVGTATGGAEILWMNSWYRAYSIAPDTGELTEEWSEDGIWYAQVVGDLDGDGAVDLYGGGDYRYSGAGTWFDEPKDPEFPFNWPNWIGDVDGDGFDDMLFGTRASQDLSGYTSSSPCIAFAGPAQLFRGSPTGLEPTPLWRIESADPSVGVGRLVARFPEQDALIVTIVEEGSLCPGGDFAPGTLGVIRDASTAGAWLSQVVPVDQLEPNVPMPYLLGTFRDQVVLVERERMQFFPWDPATATLGATPALWIPGDRTLDFGTHFIGIPLGRMHDVFTFDARRANGDPELLVWGRTVEELGIPAGGWTAAGCTFWAEPYGAEPPPPATTTTVDTASTGDTGAVDPPPPRSGRRCGCGAEPTGAPPWLLLALGIALTLGSRRAPRGLPGNAAP